MLSQLCFSFSDFEPNCLVYECMRYNPLIIAEDVQRIHQACDESLLVFVCWSWCPTSVRINSFLNTFERHRYWLTCAVVLFDSHETQFWLSEIHSGVQVSEWEIPTPPLAPWDTWQLDNVAVTDSDSSEEDGSE